jgi:hypothetical protein
VSVALAAVGASCSGGGGEEPLALRSISTRADMVTGGDVLVEVESSGPVDDLVLTRNGHDLSTRLRPAGRDRFVALVTGLRRGDNELVVRRGDDERRLRVVAHPASGPVFAPRRPGPLACTTEAAHLGPARGRDCTADARTEWIYRTTDGRWKRLVRGTHPDDMARTTVDGERVDFVVRRERGVVNRAIYSIAVLDPDANRRWDGGAWNRRLVYEFGGGCDNTYGQGSLGRLRFHELLGEGYAVATSTFNVLGTACDEVLSAETLMMVKEHFVEQYGEPRHTFGVGESGGSIQQYFVAQNYPGLLDGLVTSEVFPDVVSTQSGASDCFLLRRFFEGPRGSRWTRAQQQAVSGFATPETCDAWTLLFFANPDPNQPCGSDLPDAWFPAGRPSPIGIRCTFWDGNVEYFGQVPGRAAARRTIDNVGVQYGLEALRAGTISFDQFLDLNEHIGGFDDDGMFRDARTRADRATVRAAYRDGRVNEGGGDLRDIPVTIVDVHRDGEADVHDHFRNWSVLDRLSAGGAQAPNAVLWTAATTGARRNAQFERLLVTAAVRSEDEWLSRGRPDIAVNWCRDLTGAEHRGHDVYDEGRPCAGLFEINGDPRTAAGAPRRNDVLTCARRPVDEDAYGRPLSGAQLARLRAAFPTGVCDYSKPSPDRSPVGPPWRSYLR